MISHIVRGFGARVVFQDAGVGDVRGVGAGEPAEHLRVKGLQLLLGRGVGINRSAKAPNGQKLKLKGRWQREPSSLYMRVACYTSENIPNSGFKNW